MNIIKTFGFILAIIFILGLLWLIFTVPFVGLHIQTAQGEHTGIVTATETTGLFFKTHTAYIKTNTQSTQEDKYCVIGDDVYAKLQNLQTSNSSTTIVYIDWLSKGIKSCNAESAGVIIGIK